MIKFFPNLNSIYWYRVWLFLLVFISGNSLASNENLNFKHLTLKDGLSSNNFFASNTILQDSRGFLWFGTIDGLNRFDGYEIKIYRHQANNPNSLTSNFIHAIFEDSNGVLWVLTQGSQLNRYDHSTDQFSPFSFRSTEGKALQPALLNFIVEDTVGKIWMSDDEFSLLNINTLTGKIDRYERATKTGQKLSRITNLFKDQSDILWIGTTQGLEVFDSDSSTFSSYKYLPEDSESLPQGAVTKIFQDKQYRLWISTETGLAQFDYATRKFIRIAPSAGILKQIGRFEITSIVEDKQGWLWLLLTNNKGLLSFNYEKNQFIYLQHEPARSVSLCSNHIADLYIDGESRMWVGSRDNGACYSDTTTSQFGHVLAKKEISNGLSSNAIKALLSDSKGDWWIGTMGNGLDRYQKNTGEFTNFKHQTDDPTSLVDDRINALFEDSKGNIWIGAVGGVVSRFDPQTQKFIRYPAGPQRVRSFSEDAAGNIWIASIEKRLSRYNPSSNEFTHFSVASGESPAPGNRIHEYPILTIANAKNGDLWLGNSQGIIRFDPRENTSEYFFHQPENPDSLSQGWILSLYEDERERLWIGTLEHGLNRYDPATGQFSKFGELEGLASNIVYAIEQDQQGFLWVSTNKGLSKINPDTMQIKNYRKEDGLQDNDFNMETSAISSSGELFFGGINGFNHFYPEKLVEYIRPPRLALIDFKLFNRSVDVASANSNFSKIDAVEQKMEQNVFFLQQTIDETKHLYLSYRESFFSFDFAVINASKPEALRYSYKLEGWNERWIETEGNNRKASFTNIPAGDYLFKVKVSDAEELWEDVMLALPITISPPIWLTWWVKVIYVFLFALLLTTLFYLRTAALRRRSLLLEETVNRRTRQLATEKEKVESLLNLKNDELTNISHEFRTPLTLVLGATQQLLQNNQTDWVNEKAMAIKHSANRLLRMVEQLLQFETSKIANISTQAVRSSHEIIAHIASSFKSLAKEKNIQFSIQKIETAYLLMSSDALDKIILNLLSNAFKFTQAGGHIQLSSVVNSNQQLEISIKDNGIGIPLAMHEKIFERFGRVVNRQSESILGAGIGLALVKELVELHHGSVSVISEENLGTEFIVLLPLDKSHTSNSQEAIQAKTYQNQLIATELMNIGTQNIHGQNISGQTNSSPVLEQSETVKPSEVADESKKLILLIEDNVELRHFIRSVLEKEYRTIEASNGKAGFEMAQTQQPDVIISDVMMPLMDGFELARRLKASTETDHIPLILLTAKVDKKSTVEGILQGADDYLTKPFDSDELSARIGAQIAHKQRMARKILSQIPRNNFSESLKSSAVEIELLSKEDKFVSDLTRLLQQEMHEETFDVEQMWQAMNTTRSTLFRQVKKSFDCTPNQLLKTMRLQQALQLLKNRNGSISEVAYAVGFQSLSSFSRAFSEFYQLPPSRFNEIRDKY